MRPLTRLTIPVLFAAGLAATLPVIAQPSQGYPNKPIRLVSGFPPGGVNDIIARTVGAKIGEGLSTTVIVDNRPGASGMLAASTVAKAEPNGYTLLMYSSGFAITAAIQDSLPFDPMNDFAGVGQIGPITQGVIVSPSSGFRSLKELVAQAAAQPGKIIMGSSGAGSGSHLIGEMIRLAAGVQVVHVGFKGNADMLIQIAGGRVHYGLSAIGPAMPLVKDGKLVVLAVTTPKRSVVLPDVPTVSETLPKFIYQGGFGLLAPAKTPRNVLNVLNRELGKALEQPDSRDRLLTAGIVPTASSPEAFGKHVREEVQRFTKLVREIGLRK